MSLKPKGKPFDQVDPSLLDLRIAAGMICRAGNGHAVVNELIIEVEKDKIRYNNGQTLRASAKRLMVDARRNARHSVVLSRNMLAAGQTRPAEVAAHHIVARKDAGADRARKLIFGWNIAINDVDNGVYLPRWKRSHVPSLPNTTKHSVVHTEQYHLEVWFRLSAVAALDAKDRRGGRIALRTIKQELINGIFPYLPEMSS
ncbi:AHH domain-containing protein [Rhodanobacter sp. AS-Z3]|uniref:AHH domain-containing protein n=1 Tax=Rhodanobacter sp. AS-Z3 TaxID=3031330 RepID=UPI002478EA01|nr:AHH domain-containing protein [Rhodanobacter sp. AS-Z3]WEN14370.1 AHH domain-containing protein [Rhodanobacter sp. AS-Z3]